MQKTANTLSKALATIGWAVQGFAVHFDTFENPSRGREFLVQQLKDLQKSIAVALQDVESASDSDYASQVPEGIKAMLQYLGRHVASQKTAEVQGMNKSAETPAGHDNLGTSWKFEMFPGKLGLVYGVTVGKERYRIAPDDIQQDKWRIDFAGMLGQIWEPINQSYYSTAKEAAKDLVKLEQSGKLQSKKFAGQKTELESKWGSLLTAGDKTKLDPGFWDAHLQAAKGIRKLGLAVREHLGTDIKSRELMENLHRALYALEEELDKKYS